MMKKLTTALRCERGATLLVLISGIAIASLLFALIISQTSFLILNNTYSNKVTDVCEDAIKNYIVLQDNTIIINKPDAIDKFNSLLRLNLDLDNSFSPSGEKYLIGSMVTVKELQFWDHDTTGLPYYENASGITFDRPTIHAVVEIPAHTIFSNGYNGYKMFNVHVDVMLEDIGD